MDISTLLGASTATAPSALSFGVMGGGNGNATPSGEGLGGLDSFNQLLGNFLSLTGGEGVAGEAVTLPGLTTGEVEGGLLSGTGVQALPTGLPAGLGALLGGGLKGLNLSGPDGAGTAAKGMEGRWAQSGISLLAGGGLTGQEMNPEVVAFLNDLSSAFAAADPLSPDGAMGDMGTAEGPDGIQEIDLLTVLQGGDAAGEAVLVQQVTAMIVSSGKYSAPVIPTLTTDTAPSALGVHLTVAGTGLKALPTVPVTDNVATPAPVAAPVIPKLEAAAAPVTPVATTPAPAASKAAAQAGPVAASVIPTPENSADAPAVVTDIADEGVNTGIVPPQPQAASASVPTPAVKPTPTQAPTQAAAAAGAATAAAAPVAAPAPAPAIATNATVSGTDDDQGAITLPTGQTSIAGANNDDQVPVTVPTPAKAATPTQGTSTPTVMNAAPPQASTKPSDAPAIVMQADPAAGDVPPPLPPADTGTKATPKKADAAPITLTATPTTPTPVPGKAATKPAEAAPPIPADSSAEAAAVEAEASVEAEPSPHNGATASQATAAPVRTAATTATNAAARPAGTARTNADAVTQAEADATAVEQAAAEDDEAVSNHRMLAPKHVGTEARAESQTDMAGSAQTAGQNQPATRTEAPNLRPETEDNLLSRAITAGAKGHEGGSATDGDSGSNSGSGFAEPATVDSAATALAAGENGKVQGSDFAQSLRQTSAPHRPNAYAPPGHQMAMHVQRAVQDGNDRVSIQLNPYELGRIDVQLEIGSEGKLRAKVMVENPATLEMLQKDAKNLEKALQEAGLQTDGDSLTFSLQDSGDQAQQRQDQQDQSGYGTGFASDDVEEEDPAIIAQAQILEFGRVDVRV